jgi:hypothetical protein
LIILSFSTNIFPLYFPFIPEPLMFPCIIHYTSNTVNTTHCVFFCKCMNKLTSFQLVLHTCPLSYFQGFSQSLHTPHMGVSLLKGDHLPCIWKSCRSAQTI